MGKEPRYSPRYPQPPPTCCAPAPQDPHFNHDPDKPSCGKLPRRVDIDLLVETIRKKGHKVEGVFKVPENAGTFEILVDGNLLNLEEARQLLENEEQAK